MVSKMCELLQSCAQHTMRGNPPLLATDRDLSSKCLIKIFVPVHHDISLTFLANVYETLAISCGFLRHSVGNLSTIVWLCYGFIGVLFDYIRVYSIWYDILEELGTTLELRIRTTLNDLTLLKYTFCTSLKAFLGIKRCVSKNKGPM